MSTEEETKTSRKYDLTRTISKYLDLHMMFPLLDFVEMSSIYPADQVAQARLDLLDATNMVSVIIERRQAHPYTVVVVLSGHVLLVKCLQLLDCLPLRVGHASRCCVIVYAVILALQ